eukprot:CAMPEP_0117033906 /NCGR_PEP_ID=MMETSP0472-20121206/24190_1 /TAXON_ID=693140 ORGANISM="Tiarina fusus, Strain LIS" /NCGR_SAMPLE_ID=MMETSP0472 /ASSEMBLY_ACC=CAM_ASM_000603 /LENGTH=386 /DNA_ID=CAMNT_0004742951 /DNA_START=741 /DNA_END=1901 /DNA_ORIENTATION=+
MSPPNSSTGGPTREGNEVRNSKEEEHCQNRPTNDNSNPQQGTGNMRGSAEATATRGGSDHQTPNVAPHLDPPARVDPAQATKLSSGHRDPRKLFVGGLPPDITQEEFQTFFAKFGTIVDSVVMFDRETRRSRGFGFVTFLDSEVAKSLLQKKEGTPPMPGRLLMRGKLCEVKTAEPKETSKSATSADRMHVAKGVHHSDSFTAAHQGHSGGAGSFTRGPIMNHHYPPGYAVYGGGIVPPQIMMYQPEHHQQQVTYVPPPLLYNPSYYHPGSAPSPVSTNCTYPVPGMYYPPSPPMPSPPGVVVGTPTFGDPAMGHPSPYHAVPFNDPPVITGAAPVFALPVAPQSAMMVAGTSSAMHPVAPGIPPSNGAAENSQNTDDGNMNSGKD